MASIARAQGALSRLEEAVAVIRLLWTGGPVDYDGSFFQLHEAYAIPLRAAAAHHRRRREAGRGAARRRASATAGRPTPPTTRRCCPSISRSFPRTVARAQQIAHVIAVSLDKDVPLDRQPLIADMAAFLGEWQRRGADEVVVSWVKPAIFRRCSRPAPGGLATSAASAECCGPFRIRCGTRPQLRASKRHVNSDDLGRTPRVGAECGE